MLEKQPGLVAVEEALVHILGEARPTSEIEEIAVETALGRVLANAQHATLNVPGWDYSAMDGYAIRFEDTSVAGVTRLPISQRIAAGHPGVALTPKTAARIFTGAPIPAGANTVVMQEQCAVSDNEVSLSGQISLGQNIRRAGEDIKAGQEVLSAGTKIRPQDMGLAASVGLAKLPVYRKLRAAFFFTGDELITPGSPLTAGKIYNSNRYTLTGMLTALGVDVIDLGIVPDNLPATTETLRRAAQGADIVITSGGVSVGEEDFVKAAVQSIGKLSMWRIAMKPGKPLAFGRVLDCPFFGLPGNPVSVFITFALFVRPFILKMQGVEKVAPQSYSVKAEFEWPQRSNRREYVRARLEQDEHGNAAAIIFPEQGSGVLSSAVWANGVVDIPINSIVTRGQRVAFVPFNEFFS